MLLRVDHEAATPIYEQLAAAIRAQVASGAAAPGDRLPPARALATQLDVNVHTVLRAYGQLRDEGLLELRRGRGATIRRDASADSARVARLAGDLLAEARRLGMGVDDVKRLIERTAG
jgi:GntR family transcriptional regulator